jgi:hypothetical protein
MAINKATLDLEAEFMDRIFYRYMVFNAISKKMRNDIRDGMPDYLTDVCGIYCKTCATIIGLNKFLDKWRIFINTHEELLGYREYITDKILETINEVKERLSYDSFHDELFLSFPGLCGCSNFNRYLEETTLWNNHVRTYKAGGTFEGFIIDESSNLYCVTCNTHNEYKNIFEDTLSWRNDLNKQLKHLLSHQDYFKQVPHKVYRDILIPLTFSLNKDCVNIITGFL